MSSKAPKKTDADASVLDQHPRPTAPAARMTTATPDALDQHPRPVAAVMPPAAVQRDARIVSRAPAGAAVETGPNGDEDDYPNRIGNFHKGMHHDGFGEVVSADYDALLTAFNIPTQANFDAIPINLGRKYTNPQAGLATDTEGPDPSSLKMRKPPKLDSAEEAGEAVELYWMALLRDVPFSRFHSHPTVAQAAADLSALSDFRGPASGGSVTPATIFRGTAPGDEKGPFLSQFLLKEVPYGSLTISQKQKTVIAGMDYLTDYDDWLAVQNGTTAVEADEFDGTRRYIRTMRDMGQYVHVDALYEAYLNACLILLGMNAPVDDGNPYKNSANQIGFATFGGPHILSLVTEVATRALKCVWYQKWAVHRRLRPEAYGGLVHLKVAGHNGTTKNYPIHADMLNSQALAQTFSKFGTYLMPMAFPEGSPTHPAYGAGHATVAGACVTILKAWFDENWVIPNPVRATTDGLDLVPYTGADAGALTVGGELNKVAANIAIGRNMAGVHWRSDYAESVKLGEHVALCILKQQSTLYNEDSSFTLTRFDGSTVTVRDGHIYDAANVKIPFDC